MVFLRKKLVNGKLYWYIVESARVDGKVKTIFQVYLGSAEKILEMKRQCEALPYDKLRSFDYGKLAALLHVSEELGFIDIVNKHTDKKLINGLSVENTSYLM